MDTDNTNWVEKYWLDEKKIERDRFLYAFKYPNIGILGVIV